MVATTPSRVIWKDLDHPTYEDMVAVLINRLYPSVERIDGSGGDGGRDVQLRTDDGLIIFQLKSFTGRMDRRRRPKVEESLRRAVQHHPVRWRLVVPIDPTPGESEWFDRIVAEYPFESRWLGKTWLDSEMAAKPEIARYYAHGQRYELSELFDLLKSINAEPPPLHGGIIGEAARRVSGIMQALNETDPHYVFGLSAQTDGRVSVSIVPRYRGAERDRPVPGRIRFEFPDTAEGAEVQQGLLESLEYGTRVTIPSRFVAGLDLDIPAGLGTTLTGDLVLGPSDTGHADDVIMLLKVLDRNETAMAQLPLDAEQVTAGARGGRVLLRDKSGALTIEARFDVTNRSLRLRWTYTQPDTYLPLELMPAARFLAALESGDRLAVEFDGETIASESISLMDADELAGEAVWFAEVLGYLVNVQLKTGVYFRVQGDLTPDEVDTIATASRLLNGDDVTGTWDSVEITVLPEGITAVTEALDGTSAIPEIQVAADMSISVQRQTIPIGRAVRVLKSARVQAWEDASDGAPPGTTKLYLVPGNTNRVVVSLDNPS